MEISSLIGVLAGVITGIIAIVTGIRKFCQYVIVPIKEHFEKVHQCFQDVTEMKKRLAYELNPNGGGSLRDCVTSYGQQITRIEGIVLAILSSSDKGIWISDSKGSLIWLSSWFDDTLSWNIEDMRNNGWKNVVHLEDREKVAKEFSEAIKDGRDFIMSYRYVHKQDKNKIIRVNVVSKPIRKTSGEILGFIGFATEIKNCFGHDL